MLGWTTTWHMQSMGPLQDNFCIMACNVLPEEINLQNTGVCKSTPIFFMNTFFHVHMVQLLINCEETT